MNKFKKAVAFTIILCTLLSSVVGCNKTVDINTETTAEITTDFETNDTTNKENTSDTVPPLIDTLPEVYKQVLQNKHNFALNGHDINNATNIFIGEYKSQKSLQYLHQYDTVEYALANQDENLFIRTSDGDILYFYTVMGTVYVFELDPQYKYTVYEDGLFSRHSNDGKTYGLSRVILQNLTPHVKDIYKVEVINGQEKYYIETETYRLDTKEVTKAEFDSYREKLPSQIDIEWNKTKISPYSVNQDTKKYSQKYPNIEIEYEKILDAYTNMGNIHRYSLDEYDKDKFKEYYSNISEECFEALDVAVQTSFSNYFLSYATKDLNNDGVSELFLIDNRFHIYALMTIADGEPKVIYSDIGTHYDGLTYADSNNTIYTSWGGKGDCWQQNVLTLNSDGNLCGYSYGHYDMSGFGDDDVYNYYCEYDSEHPYNSDSTALYKRISDDELEKLEAKLKETVIQMNLDGSENTNDVTRDAGLTVYQVITYCAAK